MVLDQAENFVRDNTDSSVASGDTTISVNDASIFPDPANGEYNLVLWDADNHPRPDQDSNAEIVRLTGRDTTNNNLTVTRAQEGTGDVSHPSGSALQMSPTAAMFSDIDSTFGNFWDAANSELTADVNNSTTSTDSIPTSSWQKWAIQNLVLDNGWYQEYGDATGELLKFPATGSGSAAAFYGEIRLGTGTTSGSTAQATGRRQSTYKSYSWDDDIFLSFRRAELWDGYSDVIMYLTVGGPETDRAGFGWKVSNGEIKGVVHDGTSETTTTLVSSPSNNFPGADRAETEFVDGSVVYRLDGSKVGEITQGVPSGDINAYKMFHMYIENTATVDRRFWLGTQNRVGIVP